MCIRDRIEVAVDGGSGPVDQVEVDIFQSEFGPALLERIQRGLVALIGVPQFRGDEEVLAGEVGFGDRFADAFLIGVELRGIDVAVAGLERLGYGGFGFGKRHLEQTESELGDLDAMSEIDGGNAGVHMRAPSCGGVWSPQSLAQAGFQPSTSSALR